MFDLFVTFLIVCNFLIIPTSGGGISYYSPGVFLSVILYLFSLFAYLYNSNFVFSKKFINQLIFTSLFLIFSIILAYIHGESILVYFSKSLFLVSTLFISKLVNKKNSNLIFNSVIALFLIDLVYRVIFSGQIVSFYGFKKSLLFVDTNFIGLTLVPAVVLYIKSKPRKVFPLLGLLVIISTFSRTTYFGIILFFSSIAKKSFSYFVYLIIGFLILLFLFFPNIFQDLDGSLNTKIDIINSTQSLNINWQDYIFGFGKLGIEDIVETTVGHTILGIIMQYGFIYLVFQFFITLLFIKREFMKNFIFYWLFVGIFSLYPMTTIGLSIILFNSVNSDLEK